MFGSIFLSPRAIQYRAQGRRRDKQPCALGAGAQGNGKLSGGKQGFTGEQIKRIFAALEGETPDFQWIIRLLAYHGARSTEICQLKCADVVTLSGVPVIRIHDQHGSVKNRQSVRDIPIHPKCSALVGFAAKVAKAHGEHSWLFASLIDLQQGRATSFRSTPTNNSLGTKSASPAAPLVAVNMIIRYIRSVTYSRPSVVRSECQMPSNTR